MSNSPIPQAQEKHASTDDLAVTFIGGPLHRSQVRLPLGTRRYWQAGALYEISEADLDCDGSIKATSRQVYFRANLSQ